MAFDFAKFDTAMFDMFGVAATIDGTSITNGVIFDSPHQSWETGGEMFDGRQYQAAVVTTALPAITDRVTKIIIAGTTYTIMNQRPDGAGLTLLDLKEG